MKYYYIAEGWLRNNIGDVLQGMVARSFLPSGAFVADREALSDLDPNQPGFLLANGWFMHNFKKFPPPDNITPLYVSVHIANSQLLADARVREHFLKHSPIGCRDQKTRMLFLGWGIPAYYSGCLTITAEPVVNVEKPENGEVLLVDNVDHPIPGQVKEKLEAMLGKELVRISHDPPEISGNFEEYVATSAKHMSGLLERYCRAQLVITTKIHCALPCLGMGARVLLIHPQPEDPRLDTAKKFVKIFSYQEILKMKEILIPPVDEENLEKSKKLLYRIVRESVKAGRNIISNPNSPEFRRLYNKSHQNAKIYKMAVNLMYKTGINKKKISAVYGAGLN